MHKLKENVKRINLILSIELKKEIQKYCEKKKISASELTRLAIEEYMRNHPIEDKMISKQI